MGLCIGAPPPVRKRTPARTPSQPQSHPGRVLLRFRACPTDTPLRAFHVGAPPRCEAEPSQNTEPAPIAPGAGAPTVQSTPRRHAATGISCRSTAPGAKTDPSQNPKPDPIAPEAGAPTVQNTPRRHAATGISCRSTAPGAKTDPSQNTKPTPIAPGAGAPTVQSTPRRHAATGISCRSTAPGAKADPSHNPEPAPIAPGAGAPTAQSVPWLTRRHGTLCRSTAPVRKRSPAITPSHPRSHPGRVLLRLRVCFAGTPLWVFPVGAPPRCEKGAQPKHRATPQSHPVRVLLQPITPGGDGSEHHRRCPAKGDQRQVVVQEGGYHSVPDMVVLPIHVQTCGWPEGGVGSRGAGIAQGGGGAHQGNDRQRAEAHVHGQGYIDGGNDRHGGEG